MDRKSKFGWAYFAVLVTLMLYAVSISRGDLVVGRLTPLVEYETSFGSVMAVSWSDDGEVHHLGDYRFQMLNGDMGLEFTFDPEFVGGLFGEIRPYEGEEHWFYGEAPAPGGIAFTEYLETPGVLHQVDQDYRLGALLWDWVAPNRLDPATPPLKLRSTAASNVPESNGFVLGCVVVIMALLGIAFARLW